MPAMLLLSSCHEGVLDPHGPVGKSERLMLYDATAIMLAVVVPVILLTLVFAWWFRSGNRRARYRPIRPTTSWRSPSGSLSSA
jgi:cytochrome o ubiquinol oxidase subunit 2